MPDHLSVFGQTAPLQALIRRSLASSHAHICIRQDIFRRLTFAYIRSPYKWQKPRFYRGFLSEYLFYSLMMASMYKKDIFATFCADSNHSPLPLTGLAAAPQSSPLRSEHERHFSPIVRDSHKKRTAKAVPSPCFSTYTTCP